MKKVRDLVEGVERAGDVIWRVIEQMKVDASHGAAQHALQVVKQAKLPYTGGTVDGFGAFDNEMGGTFGLKFDGPIYINVEWNMDRRSTQIKVARDAMNPADQFERTYTMKTGVVTADSLGAFVAKALEDMEKEQGR
jgi:hypothetical protein